MVAIAGPSGAGKSVVADAVAAHLGDAVVLRQDWFFRDHPDATPESNYCDPKFLDWSGFEAAVTALAEGRPALVPVLDDSTFVAIGNRTLFPARYVIVEGMTVLRQPRLMRRFNHAFYLCPSHEAIAARKRRRDATRRGRTDEQTTAQLAWVIEEHSRELAELSVRAMVIDADVSLMSIVNHIVRRLLR